MFSGRQEMPWRLQKRREPYREGGEGAVRCGQARVEVRSACG